MPSDSSQSLRHTTDSGFPLQIALHRRVNEASAAFNWRVQFAEHSWRDRVSGESGFLDLVLKAGGAGATSLWIAVECKRVRDVEWIFLNSKGNANARRHAKVWVSQYHLGEFRRFGWEDLAVDPSSPEAEFCAVRGQSSNDRNSTLLERTAGTLVAATEALAWELRDIREPMLADLKVFMSIIVTTATLKVATFDPSAISLEDGTLADANFEEVPVVRLRKQLSSNGTVAAVSSDFREDEAGLSARKEHTVFVVRADSLVPFLQEVGIDLVRLSLL